MVVVKLGRKRRY